MSKRNGGAVAKLQDKRKRFEMRRALGGFKGVISRGGASTAQHIKEAMYEQRKPSLVQGKCADAEIDAHSDREPPAFEAKKYKPLPYKEGTTFRHWGRKGRSGCVMSAAARAAAAAKQG